MIVDHSAKRTWGFKSLLRFIRAVKIPYVGLFGHVGWHLLESELGVGSTHTHLRRGLRVPADLCNGAFDVVWVLENHNSLRVDIFGEVLGLLAFVVLLEQVNFVVLLDALFSV